MRDDRRRDERTRREAAQSHRGEVVPGSGRALEPRALPQMISVRLDADLVSDLREVAQERGTTVSDLLREGAAMVVVRSRSTPYTYRVSQVKGSPAPAVSTADYSSPDLLPDESRLAATA